MYLHKESMCPESADEFFEEESDSELTLTPILSGRLFLRVVNYPVIVEMWEKAKFGRKRVAYHKAFTESERKVISRWQTRFRKWHLVSGTPLRVTIRPKTLELLQRAANHFGTM